MIHDSCGTINAYSSIKTAYDKSNWENGSMITKLYVLELNYIVVKFYIIHNSVKILPFIH